MLNTYDTILTGMLNRVSSKMDKREGAVIFDALAPAAMELEFLYIELERIIKESYGDTASREFLILRCKERGITPYPASKAVLKAAITPADADVLGKRFNLGELNYIITEKISEGEYRAECETEGRIGSNYVGIGELIPIDYVEGLEKAELTEVLIPGEDEEDTEELRKRYFSSFDEHAFGGNMRDYLDKTNSIPGVGQTKVTRVWNTDISPKEMIPGEEAEQWCRSMLESAETPSTVKAWLTSVFSAAKSKKLTTGGTVLLTILNSDCMPASDELVDRVQTKIDPVQNAGEGYGLAPIGHVVTVQSAEAAEIHIRADAVLDAGYSLESMQGAFESAIEEYMEELRKSWGEMPYLTVRISQIETRLLAIKGVVDVSNTTINGREENLVLTKYQVPVFGSLDAGGSNVE